MKFPESLGKPLEDSPNGSEYRFNCPFCAKRKGTPDTKYHLYVNENSRLFHCFRCDTGGSLSRLEKGAASANTQSKMGRGERLADAVKALYGLPIKPKEEVKTAPIPPDFVPIEAIPESQASAYLRGRGIPLQLAIKYRLGFGKAENRGRIIFPTFDPADHSKCQYWVGRSYMNGSHSKDCRCFYCVCKYSNAPGVARRHFLYGLWLVEGDEICVAEGPISAICCGQNAVAAYGKHITKEQLSILTTYKKVQIALDPDAIEQSALALETLRRRGVAVEFVPMPRNNDPADLGISKMLELRANAVPMSRGLSPHIFCEFPR